MTIKVGDALPDVTVKTWDDGPADLSIGALTAGKTAVRKFHKKETTDSHKSNDCPSPYSFAPYKKNLPNIRFFSRISKKRYSHSWHEKKTRKKINEFENEEH